ncbi:MAG: gamma-glutamylcyclotransferase [Pseudanabaena sp.]
MDQDSPHTALCYVFVYGTLKPNEANFETYCAGKFHSQQQAIAYGDLFALPMGYPAMTVGNAQVHGYLLSFPDASILEALDELEDYQSDRASHENLYDRRLIEVFDLQGESLEMAWAYFMELAQVTKFAGIAQPDGLWTHNHEMF